LKLLDAGTSIGDLAEMVVGKREEKGGEGGD